MRIGISRCPLGLALAVAAAMGVASREARAQSDAERTGAARALYDQAMTEMASGDYESACPRLEASVKLEPDALGARLTLAECYEAGGKLASAWSTYLQIEGAASKTKQTARQTKAHERAEALRPTLARLVIMVPDEDQDLAGLVILRDGLAIERALWGVPIPVDKGSHELVMAAIDRKRVAQTFEINQDGQSVTLKLPRLKRFAPPVPVVAAPVRVRSPTGPGLPRVHIDSDNPGLQVALIRVNADFSGTSGRAGFEGASTSSICTAPCDIGVDTSQGQEFFFGGDGVVPSSRFRLQNKGDPVILTVSPGSEEARSGGLLLMLTGVGGVIAGASMIAVGNGGSRSLTAGGGVMLGLGVVAAGIGIPVFRAGRTSFRILGDGLGVRF